MDSATAARQIRELESRRHKAVVELDIPTLDAIFADDLIHVHSTGLVHTKGQLLEHLARKRGFISVERGELTVRLEGSIAIVTGAIRNRMRIPGGTGEQTMHGFVTQVVRCMNGEWRFTNFQLTVIKEPCLVVSSGIPTVTQESLEVDQ